MLEQNTTSRIKSFEQPSKSSPSIVLTVSWGGCTTLVTGSIGLITFEVNNKFMCITSLKLQ